MTPHLSSFGRGSRLVPLSLLALLPATALLAQTTAPATPATKPAVEEEAIVLSPFTVDVSKDKGYFAENTLAGSRMNTNLSDIGASITVVTKQQMEDTASVDINDVFRYEAGTQGSSTYTVLEVNRNTVKDTNAGYSSDQGAVSTNATANRVRGLSSPDASVNFFATSARIPFDAYNTQSVEISRGPNSLLFGIGSPSGIVNQSTAQAVLNKNTQSVQLRTDHNGSQRMSLALNRSLYEDKLAVYLAFLYDDRQFERKPSYDLWRRQYAAVTYKPFSKTTLRADAENVVNNANRPNTVSPRDFVTPWLKSGRPAYDPISRTVTILDTGVTKGPYTLSTLSPGYIAGTLAADGALTATTSPIYVPGITWADYGRPVMRIDDGNLVDFFQRRPVSVLPAFGGTAAPTTAQMNANPSLWAISERRWTTSNGLPAPSTATGSAYNYSTWNYAGVTNQSIYDWTKYNTNQNNFGWTRTGNYHFELDQEILPNLFFNAGWMRQDIDSIENYTVSQQTGATLYVDTNTKLPDGSTNPYFGLPYVEDFAPDTFSNPERRDMFRAQLAGELDFQNKGRWIKWLGRHRGLALWSHDKIDSERIRRRLVFTEADADGTLRYLSNPATAGWNYTGTSLRRFYYMASPGDAQNGSVTHSSGYWGNQGSSSPYKTSVNVYNWNTGSFQDDAVTEGLVFTPASSVKTQRVLQSQTFGLQSWLLDDRLTTTFGWHRDEFKARNTTTGIVYNEDGTVASTALTNAQIYDATTGLANEDLVMNRWNRWDRLSGETKTAGFVARPLKGWRFLDQPADSGNFFADFARNLSFHYNESSNFNPPTSAQTDYFYKALPKPTGTGKDLGVGFTLFDNKLVGRVTWYETTSKDERTSNASTLLSRLAYGDTTLMYSWAAAVVRIQDGAQPLTDQNWNSDTVNPLTDAQIDRVWGLMKLPRDYYAGGTSAATQDSKSRGVELQLTYNPIPNWTMKLTGSKTNASYTNVAPQYDAWLAVRMPVWTAATASIDDFTDANGRAYSLKNFWSGYGYRGTLILNDNTDGNTSTSAYFANVVESQYATAKALEGASSPSLRKYNGTFLTNYVFTHGKLRGFGFGGAERYASKAAVGYYGKAADPTQPLLINASDVTRPIWAPEEFYTDIWVSYTRKIFNDKVRMKLQLNVNNLTEDGRLEAIAYNWDGSPYGYRIIDSRSYQMTASFDF